MIIIDKYDNINENINKFYKDMLKILEKHIKNLAKAEIYTSSIYFQFKDDTLLNPDTMDEIKTICEKYGMKLSGMSFRDNFILFSTVD